MRFSDRIGVTKHSSLLLLDGVSIPLRNTLWNFLLHLLFSGSSDNYKRSILIIAEHFFKVPIDGLPDHGLEQREWLKKWFFSETTRWYDIYNLLEFIVSHCKQFRISYAPDELAKIINCILEAEMSGYRFINGVLSPITNTAEISAINEALDKATRHVFVGVHTHLGTAIELMSQKPLPDYRNSIKESISAVEALAKIISGEKSGGLKEAFTKLESGVKFHGAFKAGLLSLYGYTSDGDGIRHALLAETDLDADDAKFMLVACSAFINFIIAKSDAAGLIPDARQS